MDQEALLWVMMHTGPHVTIEEFHDWYNNEHIPLRMTTLKEFLTGARYEAIDQLKPQWSAMYEVSDATLFQQSKYTKLREHRSAREAELMGRLSIVDRRTYTQLIADSSTVPPKSRGKDAAAPFQVTVATNEAPGSVDALLGVPGWTRTHVYQLGDSQSKQFDMPPVSNDAPAYVTVHEFRSRDFEDDRSFLRILPHKAEVRKWKLYRAFDNTAG